MFKSLRIRFASARKTHTGRVLTNAWWASAATPIKVGFGIIQTGLMARMLGPEGIGTMVLLHAVCGTFESVFKIDSAEAIVVYVTKAIAEDNKIRVRHIVRYCYTLDIATSAVAFFGVMVSALFVPRILNLPSDQGWLQAVFGFTLLFHSTYWSSHALLRVTDKFSWTFLQNAIHSIVKTVAVGILFICGGGLVEAVWLQVGLSLMDGLGLLVLAQLAINRRGFSLVEAGTAWWRVPNEVWRFQLLSHGRRILKSMNQYVDTLMIGFVGNPMQTGLYRASKQVTEQMQMPAQGLLVSLYPEYSRLYFTGDMPHLRRMVRGFCMLFVALGLVAALALWFGAEWIIRIVLGDAFLPAKDLVRILMISTVTLLVMSPIYSLPAAIGRGGPALLSIAAALTIQAFTILWLVPRQGALGAAWAYVAYILTWAFVLSPYIISVLRSDTFQHIEVRTSQRKGVEETAMFVDSPDGQGSTRL